MTIQANEPTTVEIVRELETLLPPMTNYAESVCAEGAFAHSAYMVWDDPEPYIIKNGIDRLKSQEQTIAALTARAEQAEKERDAAIADIEELLGQDDFIGICWACKSHDKCVGTRDVKITCVPKWRGLPQGGE